TKPRFYSTYGQIQYTSEEDTKQALIKLAIFYVYLICITIVCENLSSEYWHHSIVGVRTLFEKPKYMPKSRVISMREVITIEMFWNYMEFVVLPLFHGVKFNNDVKWEPHLVESYPAVYGKLFLNESLFLGAPRLRQVRVRSGTCSVNGAFIRYFNTCMAPYSRSAELQKPVYKGTLYKTNRELGATTVHGRINSYLTGGYIQSLTFSESENRDIIRGLKESKWLDRGSRLVLLEFAIFNINLQVIITVKLIFEIMPTGLINTLYKSHILPANLSIISTSWLNLLCSSIVFIINFYNTFVEIKKLYLNGWKIYFTQFTTVLELSRVLVDGDFIPLDYKAMFFNLHNDILAFLMFISWLLLLKFMSFNPVLVTLGQSMRMAANDLGAFTIMFLITFTAYGNLGVLLFGGVSEYFKDFPTAFLTMVRIIVTDFNYFELEYVSPILGAIFFLSYVMIIYFVLLNMFLAIIVLSYRTAASSVTHKPVFLWYYIRKQLYRWTNGICKAPKYP
ncbi:hypothetical protein KR093_007013, partial [Drosophila rubida]